MNHVERLEFLNLVAKVTDEMAQLVGIEDRDLAEFVINLAEECNCDPTRFREELKNNGAALDASSVSRLVRLIQSMHPRLRRAEAAAQGPHVREGRPTGSKEEQFPGLCISNEERKDGVEADRARTATAPERDHERTPSSALTLGGNGDRAESPPRATPSASSSRSRGHRNRDRSRSRSRSRERRSSPERGHKRSRSNGNVALPTEPELYGIYDGVVSSLVEFGCFVELQGFPTAGRKPWEGLVHETRIARPPGASSGPMPVKEMVQRGQRVKVKVISKVGGKVTLSMRDVDQTTGEDLMPHRQQPALEAAAGAGGNPPSASLSATANPDAPVDAMGPARRTGLFDEDFLARVAKEDDGPHRAKRRMASPELYEMKQLVASGVLPPEELPGYDAVHGVMNYDLDEEDVEVELAEQEPAFLRGQTKATREVSPVKVVKNPDGSLQRSAMTQSALVKERREIRQHQQREMMDAIPKDLTKPWADPVPQDGERHLAQELRGLGAAYEQPKWKEKHMGKNVAYGKVTSKSLREQRESLPIFRLKDELVAAIHDNQVLVVIGETGSGKTTQMTQYLAEAGYASRGVIGCTQPRRVAATSVAKRVSEEFGCRLGQEVGYSIRFEDMTSSETAIKYMTDGMLMREYLMDNNLSRYSVIILDEAHERTIHTDVLFGLLKELIKKRPELKLVVTSATLDAEKFASYFFDCPIFRIPGRSFEVTVMHVKEPEPDYVDAALMTVMQIHLREPAGDILLFLTGQEEIDDACERLDQMVQGLGAETPELHILPVYGSQPSEMQAKIFDPAPPGSRKCVVATNIAEASLTIDGIYYVIDPGFCKESVYNPKLGMDSLVVVPISQASARQRAGRAGRTGPGKCYRLYTEEAFHNEMLPNSVPELQRSNLANVVLQLKAMGINDLLHFDFMDPPSPPVLVAAMEHLYALGALDDEGLLTRLGRKMAEFPLEPALAKVLLVAVDLGCSEEVLTIVAMLSVDNIFYRPREKQSAADQKHSKFHQPEGDHLTLLTIYDAWKASKFSNAWCHENFLHARTLRKGQDVRKQMMGIMDRHKLDIVSCHGKYNLVRKAFASGYFTHAAKKDPQEGYRTLAEQQQVFIHPGSALANRGPDWVIYHELVLTSKEYMRGVMAIDPRWLVELAPRFYQKADPNKMTRRKRMEKIEPLYDRFNPPDAWRLSKRRM